MQRIRLPDDFEGNGYVSVQFVRDPSSDEIFMSPLSYGVAPFSANLAARTQPVTLTAPRQVKPGATLTMRVAPARPRASRCSRSTKASCRWRATRIPIRWATSSRSACWKSRRRQILDLILPEFKRFLALAAPGGDADGGFARHLNPFNKKRKPPVAYWSGLVDVGPGGRDFSTSCPTISTASCAIVAIAVSPRRVGVAEGATEVKGDFILTPNVPATASPGDEFIVGAIGDVVVLRSYVCCSRHLMVDGVDGVTWMA